MKRSYLCLLSAGLILAACETPAAPTAPVVEPVDIIQEAEEAANPNFVFAMNSVDQLLADGNTPAAIDRLSALIGRTDLSDADRAKALYRRGQLRYSEDGYNVWGAIEDFEEVLEDYPDFAKRADAQSLLDTARGEATSLNFQLESGSISRNERFSARFRLGEHVDAIDYMQTTALTPSNEELLAMYQIGFLCNAEGLTGRSFDVTTPSGAVQPVRFCDFGK